MIRALDEEGNSSLRPMSGPYLSTKENGVVMCMVATR